MGLAIVCWDGTLDGPAVAVYSGRIGSGLASCVVLLDGRLDFSILSVDSISIVNCWRVRSSADRVARCRLGCEIWCKIVENASLRDVCLAHIHPEVRWTVYAVWHGVKRRRLMLVSDQL